MGRAIACSRPWNYWRSWGSAPSLLGYISCALTERTLAVSRGFANVSGDDATILAEVAEFGDEIDIERAQTALALAFLRLRVSGAE